MRRHFSTVSAITRKSILACEGRGASPSFTVFLAIIILLAPLSAGPASANTGTGTPAQQREQLRELEKTLAEDKARQRALDEQATAHATELDNLRNRLVTLADEERAAEEALAEIEASLSALEKAEIEQQAALAERRRHIADLLVALQRISRLPPEVTLANPDNPIDALRAALLLRDRVPALRTHAEALASVLRQLTQTRHALETRRSDAIAAGATMARHREEIAVLVSRREELSRQTAEERDQLRQEMTRLTEQAADLRQLVEKAAAQAAKREAERKEAARVEALRKAEAAKVEAARAEAARKAAAAERQASERQAAERQREERQAAERARADEAAQREKAERDQLARAAPPPPPAGGPALVVAGMRLPTGGRIVTRYGQTDRFGATSRGLTIRARTSSPVVAPQAGSVVFAGPFRGYGQILIVEHSNGYHSLIAGLGRIDTGVGKRVAAGEPMGLMPASGDPDLYFELRQRGQPINPQRGGGTSQRKG